ncbi:heavy metal-associated isoprenylated plant protein 47 [Quercus suber]|uniref:Heavy metal-associated isoprenylated plant protein 47 n=2 Tax=Quercus suber TaxID=58331 RepID=A0AAW0KEJ7_QUESU
MKQKIIIKVHVRCDKCRSKAMTVAAATDGVMSVSLQGEDKDQVVVIGEGVDAACLTSTLRKKVGYARLETVEEVKDKPADKEKKDGKTDPPPFQCIMPPPCCPPQFEAYRVVYEPYGSQPNCTIM